jgi:hypothetical protein
MIERTIKLEIREVFTPDGENYFSLFNDQGDKVAPWSDSESIEELMKSLEKGLSK